MRQPARRARLRTATCVAVVVAMSLASAASAKAATPDQAQQQGGSGTTAPVTIDAASALSSATTVAGKAADAATLNPNGGPAALAPASALGMALAQAKDTAKAVVDVPALRTKYTDTTANPNGTYTKTVSPLAMNVEQAGSWLPVDLSLHQTGNTVAAARSEVRTVLGGGGLPQVAAFTVAGHHVPLPPPPRYPHPPSLAPPRPTQTP